MRRGKEMLMDLEKLGWCEDICNELGIPIDTLPTIVPSCGHIGTITNSESESRDHQLHPSLFNVPITAILGDQQSALLGHGCVKVGQAKCTYGTGCFMLANTGDKIIQSSFGLLTTVAFKREGGPVYYALEGSVAIAGRAVQWLRDQLGVIESAPEVEKLASTVPNTGGVTVVPAFSGLFTPHWRPDARAVIAGMTLGTTKAHICRAVLEGVALQVVDVVRVMERELEHPLSEFYADGGMTGNNLLMQMQADFLPKEIYPAMMAETTAFGAAYAAGLAVDLWKVPLPELIANLGGHRKIEPHPAALERRKAIRKRWNDALQRSLGLEEYCPLPDE
ncbi:hypothetical protein FOZ63_002184 [Perkinsus olseni]|uniref:glycerol kinase n=1 Tax=Perkinsus olseni TaxID=32597 RepID=A0A7J6RA92_PEROL|nr:hypothetical protein FOZ63_002184 [Perkinsus olseni]